MLGGGGGGGVAAESTELLRSSSVLRDRVDARCEILDGGRVVCSWRTRQLPWLEHRPSSDQRLSTTTAPRNAACPRDVASYTHLEFPLL